MYADSKTREPYVLELYRARGAAVARPRSGLTCRLSGKGSLDKSPAAQCSQHLEA